MKKVIIFLILFISGVSCFAQTRNVVVDTNGAVISPTNIWSANAANARSGLGLGSAATNPATAFQPASLSLSNLANNNGASLTNITAANITGTIAISNGGSGATTAGGARTNLGLGATWLTNTNTANFRSAIGLGDWAILSDGATLRSEFLTISDGEQLDYIQFTAGTGVLFFGNRASQFRTAVGLPWSGLTNTNAATFQTALFGSGTNPVLVNTNGSVVSPTNFWQAAPISTLVQLSQPVVNATNNATNARNLYLYSLAPSTAGITNTIQLPTNGGTFLGDVATVIHEGPTNSITAVRQTGAGSNLITLNQFQEAVQFIYESGGWRLADNLSYIEPIYFSGTNAPANISASRTNLGLGATWLTNTNVTNFRTDIGLGTTNNVLFSNIVSSGTLTSTGVVTAITNLNVGGAIAVTNAAATRTNLGLGFPVLTNTNTTNFQAALFQTNTIPTNTANVNAINFNTAIHWMQVSVVTNGVTNNFRIPLFQ